MDVARERWSEAFDSTTGASLYDHTIDVISLRRQERRAVMRTLLPSTTLDSYRILELGAGTGVFTENLAASFPQARVVAVDGAKSMLKIAAAKEFLKENKNRIELPLADYTTPVWKKQVTGSFDFVTSVDALHHLDHRRVRSLYEEVYDIIALGGKILIADHISSGGSFQQEPQYDLWIDETRSNLKSLDRGTDAVKAIENLFGWTYDDLQQLTALELKGRLTEALQSEGENPMCLMSHVDALRDAGFIDVAVEYRFGNFAIVSAAK